MGMGRDNVEVEVKLRAEDLKAVEDRLVSIGASVVAKEVIEEDVYLNHPCRDFSKTDEALRVRLSNHVVSLTYKGPRLSRDEAKERVELSTDLAGGEDARKLVRILKLLGFKEVATIKKERSYYRVGDVLVSLDRVEGLGYFVELELTGGQDPSLLRDLAGRLGVGWRPVGETYLEMYLKRARGKS